MTVEDEVDPRVARSKRAILDAVLDELADVGYGAFTIESVAARAGVGKSTVYRHWRGKVALIADAFEDLNAQPQPSAGGDAHDDIVQLVRHVAEVMQRSIFSACVPALVDAAERDAELRRFHHRYSRRRKAALVRAIERAIENGDVAAGTDPALAAGALVGPIFYGRLITGERFDPARTAELVDLVLPRPR